MIYKIGSKGERVKKIQRRLKNLGYVLNVDGAYGQNTSKCVEAFQILMDLRDADGIVGKDTYNKLFEMFQKEINLNEYHGYKDSIEWVIENDYVVVDEVKERTKGYPSTVEKIWNLYGDYIDTWANVYNVPKALVVATIATESGGNADACREEPGYISDRKTPHKVSPGLMQTLISTAQEALRVPLIDREYLLRPTRSIQAGTAYMAKQKSKTNFDPPKVAAAYNAGGIYYQNGSENRWKMRQYPIGTSHHVDRFIKFYNDFIWLRSQKEK